MPEPTTPTISNSRRPALEQTPVAGHMDVGAGRTGSSSG